MAEEAEAAAWARVRNRLRERKPAPPPPMQRVVVRAPEIPSAAPTARMLAAERPAAEPVSAEAAARRIKMYIPPRFALCVLDFCPSPTPKQRCACAGVRHYVPVTPSQHQARDAAAQWAELAGGGEGLTLALLGPVGTGKSHLLYAAIRRVNERGVNAGAWGWFDLADYLRAASAERDEAARAAARDHRDRARAVKAIGLDEIRPTSGTDFDGTHLSNLMTRAYRECQDVFVTSNYAGEKLSAIVGLAASSRLTQMVVEGRDYRRPG